jgi:hypothetical protein
MIVTRRWPKSMAPRASFERRLRAVDQPHNLIFPRIRQKNEASKKYSDFNVHSPQPSREKEKKKESGGKKTKRQTNLPARDTAAAHGGAAGLDHLEARVGAVLRFLAGDLRRGVLDCFVDGEDEAGSLGGGRERVDLHDSRLPHGGLKVVGDAFIENVDAEPRTAMRVLVTQLVKNVRRIESGVIA